MASETFNPGDTVSLKSGGELMTIKAVEGENVFTVWFEGKKKQESKFLAVTLTHDDGGPVIA